MSLKIIELQTKIPVCTFSEPNDLPTTVNIDISNGSPLDNQVFIGAHYNVNSITAPGRLETLDSVAKTLN